MSFIWSQLFVTPKLPSPSAFKGQTVIVTGSNVGLGFEAARHYAACDAAKVILAVRNLPAGEEAKKSIEASTKKTGVVEVWELDLSNYASVKAFASRASSSLSRVDILMENAGVALTKFQLSENEERTVTVNVVSTFLLALLMLPKMKATAKEFNVAPRLTIVSSEVHAWTDLPERKDGRPIFEVLRDEKKFNADTRYPISKLLEVFACREIAPQMNDSGVVLNYLNPGLCHSALAREGGIVIAILKFLLARSTEVGSRTLVAASDVGKESHGMYMCDGLVQDYKLSKFVNSDEGKETQLRVWKELSEMLEKIQPGVLKNI